MLAPPAPRRLRGFELPLALLFFSTWLLFSGPSLKSQDPATLDALTLFLLAAATCLLLQDLLLDPHGLACRLPPRTTVNQLPLNRTRVWRDGGLRRRAAEHACSTRVCVRARSVLASAELLHHRIGDRHAAPAACDWCLRTSAQSSSGRGASAAGSFAAVAAVPVHDLQTLQLA